MIDNNQFQKYKITNGKSWIKKIEILSLLAIEILILTTLLKRKLGIVKYPRKCSVARCLQSTNPRN